MTETAYIPEQLAKAAPDLLAACQAIIEATGGSEHWNGETHAALLLVEAAIEKAIGDE